MPRYLLDASALLAFMSNEPGAVRVRDLLQTGEAGITAISVSEVAAKLVARGMPAADAEFHCRSMGLDIIGVGDAIAFAAAALVPATRPLGLSLGDRICLAAAAQTGSIAVTADRAWANVPGIRTELIR